MSREETANTWTHLVPAVLTLLIAWPLLRLSLNHQSSIINLQSLGTSLFIMGMLLMFTSSTIYHAVTDPVHKARLRVFDHISIYVMIAGSYSPICLSVLGGWVGWSVFGFLWACVIAGIVGKTIALGRHPRLSLALYLAMGWTALVVIWPMWTGMPHAAFWWIIAEGVFYTVGSYFFNHDEEHAFYHAIWHVFITLGALSHIIALWIILK
ncbi:MAG: hemolysin III family protein [Paludibacteraceae bacterium]|nr:hemolysin III family protein [Paludibacteraceae bacterium]